MAGISVRCYGIIQSNLPLERASPMNVEFITAFGEAPESDATLVRG